jgi:hypothetical protein
MASPINQRGCKPIATFPTDFRTSPVAFACLVEKVRRMVSITDGLREVWAPSVLVCEGEVRLEGSKAPVAVLGAAVVLVLVADIRNVARH